MQRGFYYEEFEVGAEYATGSHLVTADEIATFAALTGDDNPLHVDPEYARAAGFADVIAHGFLLQSIVMGLIAETGIMRGTTIALAGADIRFVSPVVAGVAIRAEIRIGGKRLSSNGRSGVLERELTVRGQDDAVVLTAALVNVMRLAPREPAS